MICVEVTRNNERLCTAGLPDGGWNADLMWGRSGKAGEWMLAFYVGGVTEDVSLEWVREELAVGDQVAFRVVDVPAADPPRSTTPHEPRWEEALDLAMAQVQHAELRRRLKKLEERWGSQLDPEQDA